MTKLCPRGKAAAKRKFKVYPSAYANAYASKICAGKIKDPSGTKRKDFRGPKPMSKGGGADMGSAAQRERARQIMKNYARGQAQKDKDRLTQKDIENAKKGIAGGVGRPKSPRVAVGERKPKLRKGGMKRDFTKPINPFQKKPKTFLERRKKLMGLKNIVGKGGRIGAAITALTIAGAGAAKLGQTIGKKISEKKKNKKIIKKEKSQLVV